MIKLGDEVWWINDKNQPENGNVCYIVNKKVSEFNLKYTDYPYDYVYVFKVHANKSTKAHQDFFLVDLFKTRDECIAQIIKKLIVGR